MAMSVTRLSESKLNRATFFFDIHLPTSQGGQIEVKLNTYTEEHRQSKNSRTWSTKGRWNVRTDKGCAAVRTICGGYDLAKPVVPQDVMDEVRARLTRPIAFTSH